jgi:hypothetical protein
MKVRWGVFRISENSNNKSPEFQQKKSNIFWEKGVNYESSLGSSNPQE